MIWSSIIYEILTSFEMKFCVFVLYLFIYTSDINSEDQKKEERDISQSEEDEKHAIKQKRILRRQNANKNTILLPSILPSIEENPDNGKLPADDKLCIREIKSKLDDESKIRPEFRSKIEITNEDKSKILSFFDSKYMNLTKINQSDKSIREPLIIMSNIWNLTPSCINTDGSLFINAFKQQTCGTNYSQINSIFHNPDYERIQFKEIEKNFLKEIKKVEKLFDYCCYDFESIHKNETFAAFFTYFLSSNQLFREMLISQYKSFFHFNLKCMNTRLLMTECLHFLKNLLKKEFKPFMKVHIRSSLYNLLYKLDYFLKYTFKYFHSELYRIFEEIRTKYRYTGLFYQEILNDYEKELKGIFDTEEIYSFREATTTIDIMKNTNYENWNLKIFVHTMPFKFTVYSAMKKILNIFTDDLTRELSCFCNSLEILHEEINHSVIISKNKMRI